jgi:hypothetical protein
MSARLPVVLGCLALLGCELFSGRSAPAKRVKAEVSCQGAGDGLTLECQVQLLDRAAATAEMPSMPMAHPMAPVTAAAVAGAPGFYRFSLRLAMHGGWAVHMRVSGPVTDTVVHTHEARPGGL